MTDDDEKNLDKDALLMLIKSVQSLDKFKQYKASYSPGYECSKKIICWHNKPKNAETESVNRCIFLTAMFLV